MQITYRNKTWELPPNITARDAIKKIGLDPEAVLVVVNNKLTTDDVVLRQDDQVKLVAVISGGEGSIKPQMDTDRHRYFICGFNTKEAHQL